MLPEIAILDNLEVSKCKIFKGLCPWTPLLGLTVPPDPLLNGSVDVGSTSFTLPLYIANAYILGPPDLLHQIRPWIECRQFEKHINRQGMVLDN